MLFIAIDDTVFAIGYGKGYQYIPSTLKESNFGLRCALRAGWMDDGVYRGVRR